MLSIGKRMIGQEQEEEEDEGANFEIEYYIVNLKNTFENPIKKSFMEKL